MPTKAQMDRVVDEIRDLCEEYAFRRLDEGRVALASHGRGTEDGHSFWGELTQAQRRHALAHGIDWEGFDPQERADVIGRVLDGEPCGAWMDGITYYNPHEDFARPLTQKQHAAYLEDIAASYGMTAEEMDDYYERMESEGDAVIEDGADQALPAPGDDANAREIASSAGADREVLLQYSYRLSREVGYVGFRHQYFNDPDAVKEWPDPCVRERELRDFWETTLEDGFASYRASHAHVSVEALIAHRDHLLGLLSGPEDGQVSYYYQVSAEGRNARLQGKGIGNAQPDGQQALLMREIDFAPLPKDAQRGWPGEEYRETSAPPRPRDRSTTPVGDGRAQVQMLDDARGLGGPEPDIREEPKDRWLEAMQKQAPAPADDMPTGADWRNLKAERAQDHGPRRTEDRGVNDEDEAERHVDHSVLVASPRPDRVEPDSRASERQQSRQPPPSPSEIVAQEKRPHVPENGNGHKNRHGNGHRP